MNTETLPITESQSVWDRMRTCGKPVVLYGMGNGAQKIMEECARRSIAIADIFASDEFVRGHFFRGYQVRRYSDICAKYKDFLVVVSFASQLETVLARIYHISAEHETVAPDVPVVAGSPVFDPDYLQAHKAELEDVYSLLCDEQSRQIYAAMLNYKISGKLCYLRQAQGTVEQAYALLGLGGEEDLVDLGAYRGDTIREMLQYTGGKYRSITAFEPDEKTFCKLLAQTQALSGAECHNLGAWSHRDTLCFAQRAGRNSALCKAGERTVQVDSVDNVLAGRRASYIKLDVEGAEQEALLGCAQTIATYAPKLCVSVYHRSEDLFALPLLVRRLRADYRLYLRRFSYVPAWDLNLYALPAPR